MGKVIPSGSAAAEEDMFTKMPAISNPTRTNPSHDHRPWAWGQISSALPKLPCGAITLILLLGKDTQQQHERTVEDLLTAMLQQALPVTYVAVDYAPGHFGDNLRWRLEGVGNDLADTVIDTDYEVIASRNGGPEDSYGCGLTTLDVVQASLAQTEDGNGRLVILDGSSAHVPIARRVRRLSRSTCRSTPMR